MSSDWDKIRAADFPISKDRIYLDHASAGPIPRTVYEKSLQYYKEHFEEADYAWPRWLKRREEIRANVAAFINADPSEIAFVSNTSQGMNLTAELLAGEGPVLIDTAEFPTSTVPWMWRNTEIVWQEPENNKINLATTKRLLEACHSRESGNPIGSPIKTFGDDKKVKIKTIVTSFVQYATGFRQDLEALSELKEDRYFVVNATQGFGAFPIDVKKWKVDFLCTTSHKWMMCGYGSGVFYIRKELQEKFRPQSAGWCSMENAERMNNRNLNLVHSAARYEYGTPAFAPIFCFGAGVEYLSAIGLDKISKRILELTNFAIAGLEKKGFEVVSPPEPQHRSGIVVFKVREPEKVRSRMLAKKIYLSVRGEGIRIAPHFYNNFEDIETFLKVLTDI